MVFRYTRTRSVDTRPLVSGSRRVERERTSRVSLGEDCSSVTMGLRPCLRFGCIYRSSSYGAVHPGVVWAGPAPLLLGPVWLLGPMWYALHNGRDPVACSINARFTGNTHAVRSVTSHYPGCPGSDLQQQGHRSLVDRRDPHPGAEHARGHGCATAASFGDDLVDQRFGALTRSRVLPGRPPALASVGIQRELADHEQRQPQVLRRAGPVVGGEDPQLVHLAGQCPGAVGVVLASHTDQ